MIPIKNKTTLLYFLALLAMTVFLADCGGGGGGVYGSSTAAYPSSTVQVVACPAAGTTGVTIAGMAFSPASVTTPVNGIVKWTNNDGVTHTVSSTTVPAYGAFNETLAPGASVCLKFTSAGTYQYHCTIHPSMTGTVAVQ